MKHQAKFLTASWKYLAMLNYEVDAALLLPHVPHGTELDSFQGKYFVSVVGFMFLGTRVLGLPIPFHVNFEEVNLRFYVRRRVGAECKRAVVFIKEIVPRWAIATVARVVYNEPYSAMKMRHTIELEGAELRSAGSVSYGWKSRAGWNCLSVRTNGPAIAIEPGTEAEFITEHYWGYCAQKDGSTLEYQVEHPRWLVYNAQDSLLECDIAELYGAEFVSALGAKPSSAFVALGSAVAVRKGVRIEKACAAQRSMW